MMRWYQRLFRRARTERQLDAELRFHVEQQVADYVAAGMSPEEARRRARLEFGGLDQVKEECRDVGAARFIETLLQDLRYGLRQLRRNPGFTAVAVLTLALGIGANTAIFSVVDAVLLRQLPYKDATRLVTPFEVWPHHQGEGAANSGPNFLDLRRESRTLNSMAAFTPVDAALTNVGSPRILHGLRVTANLFDLLGIRASLGRTFLPDEGRVGHTGVVVISYGAWRAVFGSNPKIIGRTLELDGKPYQIVGVMPATFRFPEYWAVDNRPDYCVPLSTADLSRNRGSRWIGIIARLAPGVTFQQAQSEMSAIATRLAKQFPGSDRDFGIALKPLHQVVAAPLRSQLLLLQFAVALLLLIACANVAGLLLSVSAMREKELAVRAAVGAGRSRIVRQLMTEAVLLFMFGGALGLAVALWTKDVLLALAPAGYLPQPFIVRLDPSILGIALAVSFAAGVIFGLLPALRSCRPDLNGMLKEGGSRGGPSKQHARNGLVIAEVAVSLLLLIGGGLMVRSLGALLSLDVGFSPHHLLIADLELPPVRHSGPQRVVAFLKNVQTRVQQLPGVEGVGFTSKLPLEGGNNGYVIVEGQGSSGETVNGPLVEFSLITPRYFRAAGIPLLAGRAFTTTDISTGFKALIVNRAFARHFFPSGNALGQHVSVAANSPSWFEIVGVVGDVRQWNLSTPALPEIYFPAIRDLVVQGWEPSYLVVRSAMAAGLLSRTIKHQVWKVNPQIPLSEMTGEQLVQHMASDARYRTELLASLALLALILTAIGVYGVVSNSVSRRAHEIGIRMALGAQKYDVLRLVVAQGMVLAFSGVAVGAAGAFGLMRLLSSLLYDIKPTDPLTFVVASLALTGVALLACYVPARRAARVDPMVALRHE